MGGGVGRVVVFLKDGGEDLLGPCLLGLQTFLFGGDALLCGGVGGDSTGGARGARFDLGLDEVDGDDAGDDGFVRFEDEFIEGEGVVHQSGSGARPDTDSGADGEELFVEEKKVEWGEAGDVDDVGEIEL